MYYRWNNSAPVINEQCINISTSEWIHFYIFNNYISWGGKKIKQTREDKNYFLSLCNKAVIRHIILPTKYYVTSKAESLALAKRVCIARLNCMFHTFNLQASFSTSCCVKRKLLFMYYCTDNDNDSFSSTVYWETVASVVSTHT